MSIWLDIGQVSFAYFSVFMNRDEFIRSIKTWNKDKLYCSVIKIARNKLVKEKIKGDQMRHLPHPFVIKTASHVIQSRSFSVTWSVALQIAWNKRKF